MSTGRWRVRLSSVAQRDLDDLLDETLLQFGAAQTQRYQALIIAALRELRAGPDHPLARQRADSPDGLRTLAIRRRGRAARHLLAYRVAGERAIEVLRILHDAMDLSRHLGVHEEASPFEIGL